MKFHVDIVRKAIIGSFLRNVTRFIVLIVRKKCFLMEWVVVISYFNAILVIAGWSYKFDLSEKKSILYCVWSRCGKKPQKMLSSYCME
jgi:hypothetical protein